MDETEHFRRNPDYIFRKVAGEGVLVPTGEAGRQFNGVATMNSTGALLWELLEEEKSVRELSDFLSREYGLSAEESLVDVTGFLETAQTQNAVIACGPG